jgi:hypothetical protein
MPTRIDCDTRPAAPVVTAVAWTPQDGLTITEWITQGRRLGAIGRSVAWWIGDWVNFGNQKFGEKYSRAARITGYDVQSLMNMAYVASRFSGERRREQLSWSHHAELAGLEPGDQDAWLDRAELKRISVHGLREELRTWRAKRKAAAAGEAVAPAEKNADNAENTENIESTENTENTENAGNTALDEAALAEHAVVCPQCGFDLAAKAKEPARIQPAPADRVARHDRAADRRRSHGTRRVTEGAG